MLCIGIPTYQRRAAVTTAVVQFRAALRGLPAEILVADNASGDGTAEAVREIVATADGDVPVRLIAGEENTGLSGNFVRLARGTRAEHLLLVSDEDGPAEPAVYERLIAVLRHDAADVLVAPSPRTPVGPEVPPEALWSATRFMPGIVLRRAPLLEALDRIEPIASTHDIAGIWNLWSFYLAALDVRISGGTSRVHAEALRVQRDELPTRVVEDPSIRRTLDPAGIPVGSERRSYKTLAARLQQTAALLTFLEARARMAPEPEGLEIVRREVERQVFDLVERLIRRAHPNLSGPFLRGARRRSGLRGFLARVRAKVRWKVRAQLSR